MGNGKLPAKGINRKHKGIVSENNSNYSQPGVKVSGCFMVEF